MANQTTTPTHPAAGTTAAPKDDPTKPEPLVATPKPDPTPIDPPVMYYNKIYRVPGIMVDTQEAADALDPNEWAATTTTAAPAPDKASAEKEWPKVYANVNVPPQIVGTAKDAAALGSSWREFALPKAVLDAGQATLDAQKAAQDKAAKDKPAHDKPGAHNTTTSPTHK